MAAHRGQPRRARSFSPLVLAVFMVRKPHCKDASPSTPIPGTARCADSAATVLCLTAHRSPNITATKSRRADPGREERGFGACFGSVARRDRGSAEAVKLSGV